MSENSSSVSAVNSAPVAEVKAGRGFSIIWVVPLIAIIIGSWLAYKALSEKGPVITITFPNADGLEAGKTIIKFKDLAIGKVTDIELIEDLSGVTVTAEMSKDTEALITDKTQFWVVRARVAAGEVSGLGTLFSGAYIGCNPSREGLSQRHFTGLNKPPVLTEGLPGSHFKLRASTLGSLDVGSPVYYRGIKVGQVVDYDFDDSAESVHLKVFIDEPFNDKVRKNTRFWNASGVDFSMDASGVKLNTESLVSIMLGGIAFELPLNAPPDKAADIDSLFQLYPDQESSNEKSYSLKKYYILYFDQSVRGLSPGAPVEIRGIKIGEVVSIELQYDLETIDFRIPVLVMIEPERMSSLVTREGDVVKGKEMNQELEESVIAKHGIMQPQKLIDKGLRAQLKTGNLLTGQLFVDLDFHPGAPPVTLATDNGYEVFPTIPVPFERILQRVENILKKAEDLDLAKIGKGVESAIEDLQGLMKDLKAVSQKIDNETIPLINKETIPKFNASLDQLNKTIKGIEKTLGPDSALNYNTRQVTEELTLTIRSMRSLIDFLERDPQALILGKEEKKK